MNGDERVIVYLDKTLLVFAVQLRAVADVATALGHTEDARCLERAARMVEGIDTERGLAEYRKAVKETLGLAEIELQGLGGGNEWEQEQGQTCACLRCATDA